MRVLVADDNREVRSALRLALLEVSDQRETEEGPNAEASLARCTILEAGDATDALVLLENRDIDLVLIDWELPGLETVETLSRLRAGLSGCTVIAISSRPEAREQSLESGADYFVCRSDPPAKLLALLRGIWVSRGT